jgi:hypothetical protein
MVDIFLRKKFNTFETLTGLASYVSIYSARWAPLLALILINIAKHYLTL